MFGERRGRLDAVETISIHGDVYYDARFQPDDGGAATTIRIASHLCVRPPAPGASVVLSFLMGQVNGVRFEEP
jgi:hypothetical protein